MNVGCRKLYACEKSPKTQPEGCDYHNFRTFYTVSILRISQLAGGSTCERLAPCPVKNIYYLLYVGIPHRGDGIFDLRHCRSGGANGATACRKAAPAYIFINACGDGAKRSRGLFPFYLPPLKMPNVLPQGTPALFNLVKVKSLSPLTRLLAGVPVQEFTMPGIFTAKELSGGPAVRHFHVRLPPSPVSVPLSPLCYFVPLSLCSFAPLSCNKYFPRKTHNSSLVKT